MAFQLMTKKGNRHQVMTAESRLPKFARADRTQTRTIDLPSDSQFAMSMKSQQAAEREEQQRIKNLVLNYDLNDKGATQEDGSTTTQLFSKQSAELLNELAVRWRIPKFTRIVIFLDVIREKFLDQSLSLEMLDTAFNYVKEPPEEETKNKRASLVINAPSYFARNNWTITDFSQMRKLLADVYHALLRDLYSVIMTSYADKAELPRLGAIMTVVDEHIRAAQAHGDEGESRTCAMCDGKMRSRLRMRM